MKKLIVIAAFLIISASTFGAAVASACPGCPPPPPCPTCGPGHVK